MQSLQSSQQELRGLNRTRGLNSHHPDARASEARISEQHLAVAEALQPNLRVVEGRLEDLDQQLAPGSYTTSGANQHHPGRIPQG